MQTLSARYDRPRRLGSVVRSERGVRTRALFEAYGCTPEFKSHAEVKQTLLRLGRNVKPGETGPAAIVVSRWKGGHRANALAYLAEYENGEVYLADPVTGERSAWPPFWDQDVSHTVVGYLKPNGDAVKRFKFRDGAPDELVRADSIGHVQGLPSEYFLLDQAQYRSRRILNLPRQVDSRYADRLDVVLDNASRDPDKVKQLAEDLSGFYGPCRIEMTCDPFPVDETEQTDAEADDFPRFEPSIHGDILNEHQEVVGTIHWRLIGDKSGVLVAEHRIFVDGDFPVREVLEAAALQMEPLLQRSGLRACGVDGVTRSRRRRGRSR